MSFQSKTAQSIAFLSLASAVMVGCNPNANDASETSFALSNNISFKRIPPARNRSAKAQEVNINLDAPGEYTINVWGITQNLLNKKGLGDLVYSQNSIKIKNRPLDIEIPITSDTNIGNSVLFDTYKYSAVLVEVTYKLNIGKDRQRQTKTMTDYFTYTAHNHSIDYGDTFGLIYVP